MSVPYSDEIQAIIATLQSSNTVNGCIVAGSTLAFFDHASTVTREIELIWSQKFSAVALLFHLNRWALFLWAINNLSIDFLPLATIPSCVGVNAYGAIVQLVLFTVWAAFSAIRLYAISLGNWPITIAVFLLNLPAVGINAYVWFAATWFEIDALPIFGTVCVTGYKISLATNSKLSSCIITHFLLNLRQVSRKPGNGIAENQFSSTWEETSRQPNVQQTTLRFASFIGNLGAELDHGSNIVDMMGFTTGNMDGEQIDGNDERGLREATGIIM
ncbi:hypothetical protein OBBRIDRAFT_763771 [Obba rivulosa]|uniref:DUF6533 domain-containing protein n=1 Tax=Obba rivulosa TaxID=1052685 RepID=A0A8E2DEG8_9APHY|nr:hypothetical protein OBBRIDRAFT_763771 [Obba rivulosa]